MSKLYALAIALLLAAPAAADEIYVDAGGGGDFADLQAAVDAAVEGDLLLVRAGTYPAPTIDGKGLWIVPQGNGPVLLEGTLAVLNLPAGSELLLCELQGRATQASAPGLHLASTLGRVHVQRCTFVGADGASCSFCPESVGGHGALVQSALSLLITDSTLQGGVGGLFDPEFCKGDQGGDGLRSTTSIVAAYGSSFLGGEGAYCKYYGPAGDGGEGASVPNWGLFCSGCTLRGGDGGDNGDFIPGAAGDGGDGLSLGSSAQVPLVDTQLVPGAAGSSFAGADGQAGVPFSGGGLPDVLPGDARLVAGPALAADGSTIQVTVRGTPGDAVFVARSARTGFAYKPWLAGFWLVPIPAEVQVPELGTIPAGGVLQAAIQVPSLPLPIERVFLRYQLVSNGSSGERRLGSVFDLAIVNGESTRLDCDANLQHDLVQILLDPATDLDADGVLDTCQQRTWYVDVAAAPGGDGSAGAPFQTIGEGLAAADQLDTVIVADGVYTGALNRNLSFGTDEIVLRSANGSASCTIDCQGLGRALSITGGQSSLSRVEGFTFLNGAIGANGGAVTIFGSSSPSFVDCVFEGCSTASSGGAVSMSTSSSSFRRCVFRSNTAAQSGGAVVVYRGAPSWIDCLFEQNQSNATHPTLGGGALYVTAEPGFPGNPPPFLLSHCVLRDNASLSHGGALRVWPSISGSLDAEVRVESCLIEGNSAPAGGAIASNARNLTLSSTTVSQNFAQTGGALYLHGAHTARVVNSILWGDGAGFSGPEVALRDTNTTLVLSYTDLAGGTAAVDVGPGSILSAGAGVIASDPLFANAAGGDFRLSAGSPCADAGDVLAIPPDDGDVDEDGDLLEPVPLDLDGNPRRVDDPAATDTGNGPAPLNDMGAYERP